MKLLRMMPISYVRINDVGDVNSKLMMMLKRTMMIVVCSVVVGCSLPKLWAGLQAAAAAAEIELDARGKQLMWQQVLNVPGMRFTYPKSPGSQALVAESFAPVHSVEDAEKRGLHIVAPEGLRESCLGLYDGKLCDAAISRDQHELLERLAKAR